MPKRVTTVELALRQPNSGTQLTRWLYEELRRAILDGRLLPGARVPATRDLARQYRVSRGTVVTAFEQLQIEGYLVSRVGGGTWVNGKLPMPLFAGRRQGASVPNLGPAVQDLSFGQPARPFRPYEPALKEFPTHLWARVATRRLRRFSTSMLAIGEVAGYWPLREAIAGYLSLSRGVNCSPGQVVIVSGAQQGLDLLSRTLFQPGDSVWVEDPGYFGAIAAFRTARAKIVPVPVDDQGLSVSRGQKLGRDPKAIYLTPAHQCPLGVTMSLERRLAVLSWAHKSGASIFEDDYDGEYRFEGRPIPSLQSLDRHGSVVYVGSFSKVLFPSLRIGYVVLPEKLIDPFLRVRMGADLFPPGINQAVLCDFIVDGHFGRHIRRMRELYASRLAILQDTARKYLSGLLALPQILAGLSTPSFLRNGLTSGEAEARAMACGVEAVALSRFCLRRTDLDGLQLGFAAFDEREINQAVPTLASALEKRPGARVSARARVRSRPFMRPA